MDFVPSPSSAAAYERYVSESDTDGEGDTATKSSMWNNLPQPRRQWGKLQGIGAFTWSSPEVNDHEYHEFTDHGSGLTASQSKKQQPQRSIFAKLASSWTVAGTKQKNDTPRAGQHSKDIHEDSIPSKDEDGGEMDRSGGEGGNVTPSFATLQAIRSVSVFHCDVLYVRFFQGNQFDTWPQFHATWCGNVKSSGYGSRAPVHMPPVWHFQARIRPPRINGRDQAWDVPRPDVSRVEDP